MCCPRTRARTSVGPPAANGTTTVIGCTGYACCAMPLRAEQAITTAATIRQPSQRSIFISSVCLDVQFLHQPGVLVEVVANQASELLVAAADRLLRGLQKALARGRLC